MARQDEPTQIGARPGVFAASVRSVSRLRHLRVVFSALWIGGQAALVLSAGMRPDHIFGFRMFPEASTMEIHLWRDTAGR